MAVYNKNTGTTSTYHYNSSGKNGYYYTGRVVVNPFHYPAWGWNRGVVWAPVGVYWGGGFWGAFAVGGSDGRGHGFYRLCEPNIYVLSRQRRQPGRYLAVELWSAASSMRAASPGRHLRAQLWRHLRKSERPRRCWQLRSECRQLDTAITIATAAGSFSLPRHNLSNCSAARGRNSRPDRANPPSQRSERLFGS
jgi:hypothetical protein